MAKVFTYSLIMIGLALFLKFAGISIGLDWLLSYVGLIDGQLRTSSFAVAVIAIFTLSTIGSIVIGLLTNRSPESYLVAPFIVTGMSLFIATIVSILSTAQGYSTWVYNIVLAVFGIFGIGYFIALVEWWRGVD